GFRFVIDEARIEEQRLRGLAMGRAVDAAAHELGVLAPAGGGRGFDVFFHQLWIQGSPAAFQPPTLPRWPCPSRSPSKPCATFQQLVKLALGSSAGGFAERAPERQMHRISVSLAMPLSST